MVKRQGREKGTRTGGTRTPPPNSFISAARFVVSPVSRCPEPSQRRRLSQPRPRAAFDSTLLLLCAGILILRCPPPSLPSTCAGCAAPVSFYLASLSSPSPGSATVCSGDAATAAFVLAEPNLKLRYSRGLLEGDRRIRGGRGYVGLYVVRRMNDKAGSFGKICGIVGLVACS
ncbi:hypothetical protein H6P81_002023 [Aristolochia fimbriata]|uniref:Uncharacterized protein n=1 Tax=Aristolochia fimbriata TaxID=158543 RepID=A0AAV7F8I8_ARIFI|nr:hypothetical protein H6P81_002023 [Aristolochia fimbriata]